MIWFGQIRKKSNRVGHCNEIVGSNATIENAIFYCTASWIKMQL
jgi:hypothetical protein